MSKKLLKQWQTIHGISDMAIHDLNYMLGLDIPVVQPNLQVSETGKVLSETAVQTNCRLKASKEGWVLWRNNVGVAVREDGVPVRYGLCNESKKMNENIKSSDLIGIRPITITPEMVGKEIGQFVAREVKKSEWEYTNSEREQAQLRYIEIVNELGGDAKFINNSDLLI